MASIYAWHRRYLKEGMLGLMNTKDRKRGKLQPPADSANAAISSSDEVKQLKDQLYEMQMEIDLLKATIDVLKKRSRRQSGKAEKQRKDSGDGCRQSQICTVGFTAANVAPAEQLLSLPGNSTKKR